MIPNNVMTLLNQLIPNASQFQNVKTPDEFAQQLLNSGKIDQNMVNRAKQMWQQPNIRQMIQSRFKI